jgi:hypothetical protein
MLPRAKTQSGVHGATQDPSARGGSRHQQADRRLSSYGSQQLVADHYFKLGFAKVYEESDLAIWELLVKCAEPEGAPMEVISRGFEVKERVLS